MSELKDQFLAHIFFQAERGGVSIETTRLSSSIVSNLIITSATYQDSGVYTCKPLKGQSAKVLVTILESKYGIIFLIIMFLELYPFNESVKQI